ncbi:acyl carrier protein [Streptomyces sp. NPDC056486]|uniref:acyl carrier protein n=1 Tax=Streptomyces sp. NPDC056486 TaxID=3345835 RepID=UPI00367ECC27
MTTAAHDHVVAELCQWLTERLALHVRQSPDAIGLEVPLAAYGLDSVIALSLCGDAEDAYGIELDPTVVYDYPTIVELARHLAGVLSESTHS